MSLKLSNLATAKQIEWLKKMGYEGTGKYAAEKLTKLEAIEILDELFEEKSMQEADESFADYYNNKE